MANTAAWITSPKSYPFEVKAAPTREPGANEILVRNRAIAINPIDGLVQATAFMPRNYPDIFGSDVAGEVIAVGPDVTRFKVGDRILGHATGFASKHPEESAFQAQTILKTVMASKIPDDLSFERAAAIPLGLSTAASGLFQDSFLNLQLLTEPPQKPTGKTLLLWGGSSSVGSNAIQLCVAAGYEVITTASPKKFEYVKELGASQAFDYNSPSVSEDLLAAFKEKTLAGAFCCIAGPPAKTCIDIVHKLEGNKFVAVTTPGFPDPPEGVQVKLVQGPAIIDNHVGPAIYEAFLPKALKAGSFVPSPEPFVVGKGLDKIQEAVDLQKKGVSAKKIVVLL